MQAVKIEGRSAPHAAQAEIKFAEAHVLSGVHAGLVCVEDAWTSQLQVFVAEHRHGLPADAHCKSLPSRHAFLS